ncbi:diguanylate cyclase [Phyllobacterium sp. SB3]|uniref:GGDEF domain-containing protein n=1 Tax=Phyllobacterium sp. SB3 TaxID=3156073 RepID=UPI0032AF4E44
MTNSDFLMSAWLAAAHMSFVIGGYLFLARLSLEDRRLRRPFSIVYLCIGCAIGASAAGVMGNAPAIFLVHGGVETTTRFCVISEFANSLIILPMVLAAPPRPFVSLKSVCRKILAGPDLYDILPMVALGITIAASILLEGPGAFAYPVPALLWCALRYDIFSVTLLTFLFSIWPMIFQSGSLFPSWPQPDHMKEIMSLRFAVGLIALGPLAVASMNVTRNELIKKLRYAASHDFLTNTLSRSALITKGQAVLDENLANEQSTTVIVLDIDHFKRVNDQYGHAAGDAVLVEFSARVTKSLRNGDLFGRFGGEEFVILLPGTGFFDGSMVAERVRQAVEDAEIFLPSGDKLRITVSGGIAVRQDELDTLEILLSRADRALYVAKAKGRNTIQNNEVASVICWPKPAG